MQHYFLIVSQILFAKLLLDQRLILFAYSDQLQLVYSQSNKNPVVYSSPGPVVKFLLCLESMGWLQIFFRLTMTLSGLEPRTT